MSRLPLHFGPYEPVQRLGAGGMAETFVAVRKGPLGFEQRVCIKRILPAYEANQEFVDAFLLEARTSAQLRHANIVQVLDFGIADESHYLSLELIDGVDLRALLKRGGPHNTVLAPELVTLVANDVAMALDYAHRGDAGRAAVVHRDVSPSNVLASRAGEIKLTDFGIARAIGDTHQTATGIIKGKIPYLPPEYIERGEFDARSDLFSLGVMLHELLVGVRPFDGENDLDTVRRIVAGERPSLRDLAPTESTGLARCIDRLLATDARERFASAHALIEALPQVSVHRARLRLGELVRAQLGEIDTGVAPAGRTAAVASAPDSPPNTPRADANQPTRTARAPARLSRGALLAASAAATALITVSAIALLRADAGAKRPGGTTQGSTEQPADQGGGPSAASATRVQPLTPPVPTPPAMQRVESPTEGPTNPRATAELRVIVVPFGDVWVDGKPRGHAPISVKLAPGSHEVAWGDGRPIERRPVQLSAGEHASIVFRRATEVP